MRSVICIFALLCTVYSLRVVDPIDRPIEQPIEQPIELPPQPSYRPKGCLYEGKFYPIGQFKPNDCMSCDCQANGQVVCAVMDCAPPQCSNPVRNPGQCCPICRGYYGLGDYRPVDPNLALPQSV